MYRPTNAIWKKRGYISSHFLFENTKLGCKNTIIILFENTKLCCKNSGPSKYLLHIHAFSCNTCYETPSLHWKTCLDHCGPLGTLGDKCCLTDHTCTHGLYVCIKAIHKVCFYINTLYFTIYYNIVMWQNGKRNNDWEWTAFLNSWFVVVHSFN